MFSLAWEGTASKEKHGSIRIILGSRRAERERGDSKTVSSTGQTRPSPFLFFLLCRGKARNSSFDAREGWVVPLSPIHPFHSNFWTGLNAPYFSHTLHKTSKWRKLLLISIAYAVNISAEMCGIKRRILYSDNPSFKIRVKPKPPCLSAITLPFTTPIASPFLSLSELPPFLKPVPFPFCAPIINLKLAPRSRRSQLESDRCSLVSPFSRCLSLSALSSFPVLSLDLPREILSEKRLDIRVGSTSLIDPIGVYYPIPPLILLRCC